MHTHTHTYVCARTHTHTKETIRVHFCVFFILLLNIHFFTAKLTGCQNTVINCFLGHWSIVTYANHNLIIHILQLFHGQWGTQCRPATQSAKDSVWFTLDWDCQVCWRQLNMVIYLVITHNSVSQHLCINKNAYWLNSFVLCYSVMVRSFMSSVSTLPLCINWAGAYLRQNKTNEKATGSRDPGS